MTKHVALIKAPPVFSGKRSTPDGAINGNGCLAVILGNSPSGMRIYIAKSDLWYASETAENSGIKPLGYIDIDIEGELYKNYRVEQDMDRGEVRCEFKSGEKNCSFTVFVSKTENAIVIKNSGNVEINPRLKVFSGDTSGEKGEKECEDFTLIFRSFAGEECAFETHCFAAMKKIENGVFYTAVLTNFDCESPEKAVKEKMRAVSADYVKALYLDHIAAWKSFWEKSSFSLSDKTLENAWYASQYCLAICTGNKKFPPGLFANFITVENAAWKSDYHLNYNYQAPFYAACSSNHVEFTDGYLAPLEDFLKKGELFAKKLSCRGVLFPVGIMPGGLCSELDLKSKYWFDRLFLGQKSNQIHSADIAIFRWYATRDEEYARLHAYPFLKKCLEFFESYLVKENGRYSVLRDSVHEVPMYKSDYDPKDYKYYINDKNNVLTLGMLRLSLAAALDMAKALSVDPDKTELWSEILSSLAPFPTYTRYGKRVFRYTEKGQAWNESGDVGLQHIYPAGCVGMFSEGSLFNTAKASFKMKAKTCFNDENAVTSFFPMAQRLLEDPKLVTKKLKAFIKKRSFPNTLFNCEAGGLEFCSLAASTLNESVLQSYSGTVVLFPNFYKKLDCEFNNLRADGAFLVSSSFKDGKIGNTHILSEKGGRLKILMPEGKYSVYINGVFKKRFDKAAFELCTDAGDNIGIIPI